MQAMQLKVAGLAILEGSPTPSSVEVHLKILKAIEHVYRWTKEDNALGRKLYEEAIALDPEYGPSYRFLGWTHYHDVTHSWSDSRDKSIQKGEELANKAISCGDNRGYSLLSSLFVMKREFDKALAVGEKALRLNPNQATVNAMFSIVLSAKGRREEAIAEMKKAIRLNPHHPPWYFGLLGRWYVRAGKYEESIPLFEKYLQSLPHNLRVRILLTASYSFLGREKEAHKMAREILRIEPKFSIEKHATALGVKDKEAPNSIFDALRKAGLE
jgi:tetratricopeptide (TPR) repeat protein